MLFPGARSPVNRSEKAGTFLLPVVRIDERLRLPRGAVDQLIIGEVPGYVDRSPSLLARRSIGDVVARATDSSSEAQPAAG
jgi:hypothetical protein